MPKFKTEKFVHRNGAGVVESITAEIYVNAGGEFYTNLPYLYLDAFSGSAAFTMHKAPPGKFRLQASTFDRLKAEIGAGLRQHMTPEVSAEHVIRYNIESHVSFATTKKGEVVPNAGFPGAAWGGDRELYGDHHAAEPARGGYSLTVGARAMTKTVTKYGDRSKVDYSNYYKGGSHLEYGNPAQLLNSWTALHLPERCKEIPYTDEAALFFHRLMLGMAQISKQIQERTSDQQSLLALISSGVPLLGSK